MNKYKELVVWQKAIELTVEIYKSTATFPTEEKFSLVNQINRSAVSIASNIAEGAGRNSSKEFYNFLGISIGSLFELETQLIISNKMNYIDKARLDFLQERIEEISKMLFSLQKSLKVN